MNSVSIAISAAGLLFTAAAFFIGRFSSAGTKGVAEGEQKAEIKHIKEQVDKLVLRAEESEKFDRMAKSGMRIAMLEHNRLNEHLRTAHGVTGLQDYILSNLEDAIIE